MALGNEIFAAQVEEIGEAIRDAIRTNDVIFLRGIQAMDSTIWPKVRGAESVICTIITNAYDHIDLSNPSRDRASKIETVIMEKVRSDWHGISRDNVEDAIEELGRLGLAQVKFGESYDRFGTPKRLPKKVRLTPLWDPTIQVMLMDGEDSTFFASSIGKLIGLSIAGQRPDAIGRHLYGLGSWKPVAMTCQEASSSPDFRVRKDKMEEIFVACTTFGMRKYQEFRQRDKAKAEKIRFIADDGGEYITINNDAVRAYGIIMDRAIERLRERTATA